MSEFEAIFVTKPEFLSTAEEIDSKVRAGTWAFNALTGFAKNWDRTNQKGWRGIKNGEQAISTDLINEVLITGRYVHRLGEAGLKVTGAIYEKFHNQVLPDESIMQARNPKS